MLAYHGADLLDMTGSIEVFGMAARLAELSSPAKLRKEPR